MAPNLTSQSSPILHWGQVPFPFGGWHLLLWRRGCIRGPQAEDCAAVAPKLRRPSTPRLRRICVLRSTSLAPTVCRCPSTPPVAPWTVAPIGYYHEPGCLLCVCACHAWGVRELLVSLTGSVGWVGETGSASELRRSPQWRAAEKERVSELGHGISELGHGITHTLESSELALARYHRGSSEWVSLVALCGARSTRSFDKG